jgi:hypothetical protein
MSNRSVLSLWETYRLSVQMSEKQDTTTTFDEVVLLRLYKKKFKCTRVNIHSKMCENVHFLSKNQDSAFN